MSEGQASLLIHTSLPTAHRHFHQIFWDLRNKTMKMEKRIYKTSVEQCGERGSEKGFADVVLFNWVFKSSFGKERRERMWDSERMSYRRCDWEGRWGLIMKDFKCHATEFKWVMETRECVEARGDRVSSPVRRWERSREHGLDLFHCSLVGVCRGQHRMP